MFTGLISEIGRVTNIISNQEGKIFTIHAPKTCNDLVIGDSVSINGTCLTATEINTDSFNVQAVHVTLHKTNLGTLSFGHTVNLELALKFSDRLGGHLVQGHVNGVGTIMHFRSTGNNYEIAITLPVNLRHYMIKEGSIALDGISLTIAQILDQGIMVSIIPHTWSATTLCKKNIGDPINIEVDVIAKYVEQFMRGNATHRTEINRAWLQEHGY